MFTLVSTTRYVKAGSATTLFTRISEGCSPFTRSSGHLRICGRAEGVVAWLRGRWGPGDPQAEALTFSLGLVELCDIPKGPGFSAQGLEQVKTAAPQFQRNLAMHFQKT